MALIGPGGRPVTSTPVENKAAGNSPHIKDAGLANFAAEVLEASRQVPVIARLVPRPANGDAQCAGSPTSTTRPVCHEAMPI